MFKDVLRKMIAKQVLTEDESYQVMKLILEGKATDAQISSFISLLTFRGVEVSELIGLTRAMRELAVPVKLTMEGPLVDTCGTGGDGLKTFNVSTASALVAASGGVPVAKHGNRAASSLSGSADVLEVLGLPVEMSPGAVEEALRKFNMCFMFAPLYHRAMKHAAGPRQEIGFRNIFNLLGPLTNPAGTKHQVIGIFDNHYSEKMALTLQQLGARHILIVSGRDGLDEFSVCAPTQVTELIEGRIERYQITPEDVGLSRHSLSAVQVETAAESAALIVRVLTGEDQGAAHDLVAFNAGAALYVGKKTTTLAEGVTLARELIHSGRAYRHYKHMIENREAIRHA